MAPASDILWSATPTAHDDVLLYIDDGAASTSDISMASISGSREPERFLASDADETGAQFSPDGKFVAYQSDETGRFEIFVAAFPQGGRWQVSQNGGRQVRWNRNGRELFFRDPENYTVSVSVERTSMGFQTGAPQRLFQFHGSGDTWCYDVAPDGERFLVVTSLEEDLATPVTLITDWTRKIGSR